MASSVVRVHRGHERGQEADELDEEEDEDEEDYGMASKVSLPSKPERKYVPLWDNSKHIFEMLMMFSDIIAKMDCLLILCFVCFRRPSLPPAKQANKNLILKAISEAQESINKTTTYTGSTFNITITIVLTQHGAFIKYWTEMGPIELIWLYQLLFI